jgi:hypothetical protein
MNYITINTTDFKTAVARDIAAREQELFSYDLNITYFTEILKNLPAGDWPTPLKKAKAAPKDEAQAQEIAAYMYRDQVAQRLLSERIERSRSFLSYTVMLSLLPEDEREALVLEAKKQIQP